MRPYILLPVIFFLQIGSITAQNDIEPGLRYRNEFEHAYSQFPEIPRGILEAVSFNRTRINFIGSEEQSSCIGLPNAWGVFGLIEDGQDYFKNTLAAVSQLSGIHVDQMRSLPDQEITAYASALNSVANGNWSGQALATTLNALSELPSNTEEQLFALEIQTYEVIRSLNDPDFMMQFGYEPLRLDLELIFGENLSVLSSQRITIGSNSIYSEDDGAYYRAGGGIAPCYDFAADAFVQTPSCNYSSRAGTAISAVTIHTIQGTYAGAISWAQNCNASVSYHYVVSNTGQITQMLCESDKGWHVGSENPYTIGIEHDGYVSNPDNYTAAMYAATGELVFDITQSGYGISPLRTAYFPWSADTYYNVDGIPGSCVRIKGHQHFPNQTHTDPGQYWDWDHFYKMVNPNTAVTSLTDATGNFYDSGGQIGVYSSDERSLTLIAPTNASTVSVTFTQFDLELDWDYLYIYDGDNVFSPLIGYYTGTDNPGTVTSNNGTLLFEFRSDCSTTNPGWAASWSSEGADVILPTVSVSTNNWETQTFSASFSDSDNNGGSGVNNSERFYLISDFDATRWSANRQNGFLFDDFNQGFGDWSQQVGTWSSGTQTVVQTDEANTNTNLHIPVSQTASNSYLYSFHMKIGGSGTNRRAGIHFMCSDANLPNRGNSYFIYLRADNDKCQIYKVENDTWTLETDDDLVVNPNVWYVVKTVFNRNTGEIRVYVNGSLVSSWMDSSPLSSGSSISLRTGNCTAEYDDVRVYRSRTASASITVGNSNSDVRYQNSDQNTPSCKIRSLVFDNAGNCSTEAVRSVNIDWTAPVLSEIRDGQTTDIDETNDGNQLYANWNAASDPHSGIAFHSMAIGDYAGGTNILNWTNVGANLTANVPYALVPFDWYYTQLKATNNAGLESAALVSNGQQYVPITVGIDELTSKSVYPNPTTGIVNLPQVDNLSWQLFDMQGKLLRSGKGSRFVDLHSFGLADQQYIIRVMNEQTSVVHKITLVHEN